MYFPIVLVLLVFNQLVSGTEFDDLSDRLSFKEIQYLRDFYDNLLRERKLKQSRAYQEPQKQLVPVRSKHGNLGNHVLEPSRKNRKDPRKVVKIRPKVLEASINRPKASRPVPTEQPFRSTKAVPRGQPSPVSYNFGYGVNDPDTGDTHHQEERRKGNSVSGSYSFVDAEGVKHIVEYTADGVNGYNAVVRTEAPEVTKQPVLHQNQHDHYIPPVYTEPSYELQDYASVNPYNHRNTRKNLHNHKHFEDYPEVAAYDPYKEQRGFDHNQYFPQIQPQVRGQNKGHRGFGLSPDASFNFGTAPVGFDGGYAGFNEEGLQPRRFRPRSRSRARTDAFNGVFADSF